MTAASPHVTFRKVRKTYDGEHLIVRDLDLDIERGEFLTLLGPSGSGKTTCLMMLAGFETPTAGEIRLGGKVINKLPPWRRNIGVVFQNYALFPHMTVRENIRFPLAVRKLPAAEIDAKVKQALAMVKLEAFGDRYPQQLSGGQQQRIALARALVFSPELVLMDEPLGALDKQLREHMQLEIKHLHDSLGITFVFVTHDQSEALTMSDRIAVFDKGRIQQLDRADALYERPANAFVAGFIGESNALAATVERHDGSECSLRLADGSLLRASVGDLGSEKTATVSIRPERVLIDQAAEAAPSRFTATVKELVYLGDHLRLRLDLAGNASFMVKLPAGALDRQVLPEQRIAVGIRPEHARAFAETRAA
ncbi:ABC transporter ATP-binding protein [Derxia lacustris]|uniref:ABC transporter ATP-binding protein n=1 Tax=Derxia lacustris TaxID=764842 RepID=UPI000A170A36|nr:ABC transporter ATP-binding protein [Derxia lacustris]